MADKESNPEPQEQNDSIQLDQAVGGQQLQHENVCSNENPPIEQKIKDTGTKPKIRKESIEHDSEHDAKVPDTLPETQNTHRDPRMITHNVVQGTLIQQPHNLFGQGLTPTPYLTYAQVAARNENPFAQLKQQQFNYMPMQQQQPMLQQTQHTQMTDQQYTNLQNEIQMLTQKYQDEKITYETSNSIQRIQTK